MTGVFRHRARTHKHPIFPVLFSKAAGGGAYSLTINSGSFSLSGTATTLEADRVIGIASGSLTLSGSTLGLFLGSKLAASSDSFTLSGTDIAGLIDYKLGIDSGIFA